MFNSAKRIAAVFLLLCLLPLNVYAATFAVKLVSISKLKASEYTGDELYFAVTEFSSHGDSEYMRVPSYPMRWLSSELDHIQDVVLWKGDILSGEAIQLQLSLIEMDVSPWNVDDLVGTAKLKIKNENDVIRCDWLKTSNQTVKYSAFNNITRNYHFNRDGAIYSAVLKLEKI